MDNNGMLTLQQNQNSQEAHNQIEFTKNSVTQRNNLVAYPNDGSITSRLMNTKIVRIRIGTRCACVEGCRKMYFEVNTISRRDDSDRKNENETPLFYAEENTDCNFCSSCKPFQITIELFDANTKELVCKSQIREYNKKVDECFGDKYIILSNIYNYKINNQTDESIIHRYDTRSFYRTYSHLGQNLYKIGQPYIKKETTCGEDCSSCILDCCCCCCDCKGGESTKSESKCCDCKCCECCCCCCCCCGGKKSKGCCCCCSETVEVEGIDDKRTYIDIFTMTDQNVGKFAEYINKLGLSCAQAEMFYEVYFPPESNDQIRLALIGQILFFIKFNTNYFGILPGSRYNLEEFII